MHHAGTLDAPSRSGNAAEPRSEQFVGGSFDAPFTPPESALACSGVAGGIGVATAAMLPAAAHPGGKARQASVLEEMAADALHRRGFPATHTRASATRLAPPTAATS